MYVVGLTGGIGSGKSAVASEFIKLGIQVVDADVCSRVVVELGKPALLRIAEHFGDDILLASGELNRGALRKIVFEKPEERGWLEKLLHPLIYREIQNQLNAATGNYVILASPLLVETGQSRLTNRIVVVDVAEDTQLQRTMSRDNNSAEQIKAIMAAQTNRAKRLSFADDVIDNDGSFAAMQQQVATLHEKLLELARGKSI